MTLDLDLGLRMRRQPARVALQHRAVLVLDRIVVVAEMNVAERTLRAVFPGLPIFERIGAASARAILAYLISVGIFAGQWRRLLRRASGHRQHHRNTYNRHRLGQCRTAIHPTTPTKLDRNHYRYPPSKRK